MALHFDVQSHHPKERLSVWHDVIWRNYVPLDISTQGAVPDHFAGKVSTTQLWDLRIATTSSPVAHGITRTQGLINQDDESLLMVGRQVIGHGVVTQGSNRAVLGAGDFVLWDTRAPYNINFAEDWKMQVFQIPRERLGLSEDLIARIVGRTFTARDGFHRGVSLYLGALADQLDDEFFAGDSEVAARTTDLILTTAERLLGATISHGPPDGMRRRVLAFIDANLGNPELYAESIARNFGISVRNLHRVFADGDVTLGEEIRRRRMSAIRRELVDPRRSSTTVAAIARNWGYPDPPHFSREFKRRYGTSPTQWRSQAKIGWDRPDGDD